MAELRSRRYGVNPFKGVSEESFQNITACLTILCVLIWLGRATRHGGISSYLDADIHKVDI